MTYIPHLYSCLPSTRYVSHRARRVCQTATLNSYTISLNCNNSFVYRTINLQQNVARMLFPVKDLKIYSFNNYLLSPCSMPHTEKVLGTQQ